MRVLLVHSNFPAQFRHLCVALGSDPADEVVFLTMNPRPEWNIPGVRKAVFLPDGEAAPGVHPLAAQGEEAARLAAGALKAALALRDQGFVPDVIYSHSGWGPGLYLGEVFPEARRLCYFEWFYDPDGADARFGGATQQPMDRARARARNLPILMDLANCRQGICPSRWQAEQFPPDLRRKLTVLPDGVDTEFFRPAPDERLVLPGLDLSGAAEIVTYATRGMEPYRGFPQFMEAAARLMATRPACHVVVVGDDRSCYGPPPGPGRTWKQEVLERLRLDPARIHFTGSLPYGLYRKVLRAGSVHVYLTRPFVLSWSFLEALSCGCLVVASDTEPVREVARDGVNALLTDFHSPQAIAARVAEALDRREESAPLRAEARRTILRDHDLRPLLARHVALVKGTEDGGTAAG
ncbi:MAG TPA: glycosyltransferase [Desulfovibrio sp.]|jgi:glycosyltransferase involved in cell wall biosynthesis|uniref:glycosyltransferase n=1 Tax=Desulfovibrio TaxID=872 RepID=UPI002B6192F8|nr:glycosyltransferase [Desulfovibrio sp.]HMM39068.1 glycosyltransferase [Desulfovibrio sp.]